MCKCGHNSWVRGLCKRCYFAEVNSRVRFGGHREEVLERDNHTCICGAPARLVHHRKYDPQSAEYQRSLCRKCHARIHRLARIYKLLPAGLIDLWMELHPGKPAQLPLPLD